MTLKVISNLNGSILTPGSVPALCMGLQLGTSEHHCHGAGKHSPSPTSCSEQDTTSPN